MQKLSKVVGIRARWCCAIGLAAAYMVLSVTSATSQDDPHVAGLTPDQRPAWAPKITTVVRSPDWEERAVAGIATPLPPLPFLKDQGNWYTPFTRPGMLGPYDIRGLHSHGPPAKKAAANDPAPASQ